MVSASASPVDSSRTLHCGIGQQDPGAFEGVGYAPANILLAHMLVKLSLTHSQRRLFPGPAKNELPARFTHAVGKVFQRLETRGINRRHVSQSQDNDRREMWQTRDDRIDLVRSAEQEGPVDSEDADIGRNLLVLQDVDVAFSNVLSSNFGHSGGLRDLS